MLNFLVNALQHVYFSCFLLEVYKRIFIEKKDEHACPKFTKFYYHFETSSSFKNSRISLLFIFWASNEETIQLECNLYIRQKIILMFFARRNFCLVGCL